MTEDKEKICVECDNHVFGDGLTRCIRHRNIITGEYVPCNVARGVDFSEHFPYHESAIECDQDGAFWTPIIKKQEAGKVIFV